MKTRYSITFILLALNSVISYAGDMADLHPVAAIGGGVLVVTDIGGTQNFPIQNVQQDEYYSYQTNSTTRTAGFFDLFLGLEQPLSLADIGDKQVLIQYGFNYHQPSVLTIQGQLTQGLDAPSSNTYSFRYQTIPHQLLAEAKVLYPLEHHLNPYIFGGIGASINSASQYSTNVPPFITFTRQYQNNTNSSFSYAVGAGVDLEVKQTWRFGVGWRFNDFGTTQFGAASINTIPVNGTLSLANMYSNELLFQLSKIW